VNWKFWEKKSHSNSVVLGLNDELGKFFSFGMQGHATTAASALALYESSTAVSIPINMIADAFASITPVLEIDGSFETKHPILDLLNIPSPYYTKELFFEALAKDYLITGEEVIIAIGGVNRPPLELQPISPSNLSVNEGTGGISQSMIISGNTMPGQYNLITIKSKARYLQGNLKELKQTRNFSPRHNSLLRGMSPLRSASAEARQHIKGNAHNVALLENGGKLSLVFNIEDDLSVDEFKAAEAAIHTKYGGSTKAGSIGVTSGGKLDIQELGTSNKDMDFVNMQQMAQRAVALQYKVPLPLVTTDASTFNNYAAAKLALYDDAVLPLADRLFSGLSQLLVPRYGLDVTKVKITYNPDKITALESRRNENLKLRKELNIESLNELRAMVGREDVEGGDEVYISSSMMPIATDIFKDEPKLVRDK